MLREIINREDPLHFIAGGAPEDHYQGEISMILSRLTEGLDDNDVPEVVRSVFVEMFDEKRVKEHEDALKRIADEIIKHREQINRG